MRLEQVRRAHDPCQIPYHLGPPWAACACIRMHRSMHAALASRYEAGPRHFEKHVPCKNQTKRQARPQQHRSCADSEGNSRELPLTRTLDDRRQTWRRWTTGGHPGEGFDKDPSPSAQRDSCQRDSCQRRAKATKQPQLTPRAPPRAVGGAKRAAALLESMSTSYSYASAVSPQRYVHDPTTPYRSARAEFSIRRCSVRNAYPHARIFLGFGCDVVAVRPVGT